MSTQSDGALNDYLADTRELVLEELERVVPDGRHSGGLYEIILEYPFRDGKWLRPALCLALCEALGGGRRDALASAAVLELYHTAFLIHDDIEDGSELRRGEPTLHRKYGLPIAVNAGDGILALAMRPLLDNMQTIGLGRALQILEIVARMSREAAEGQMLELDWVQRRRKFPTRRDYVRIVYKKTCWYSFLAPALIGAHCAGADNEVLRRLGRFTTSLGIAFQIVDDLLNLTTSADYGKETQGDLWEGKYTPMLIAALERASPRERANARRILSRARPGSGSRAAEEKDVSDVAFLSDLIARYDGVAIAQAMARRYVDKSTASLGRLKPWLHPCAHTDFLNNLVNYVVERQR